MAVMKFPCLIFGTLIGLTSGIFPAVVIRANEQTTTLAPLVVLAFAFAGLALGVGLDTVQQLIHRRAR
jgi:flagellar biosynthesis protein FliQ